jgi:ribosomal protein L15E
MRVKHKNYYTKEHKPSKVYVYYVKESKIFQITLKTLLRKLNNVTITKKYFQTQRQAQKYFVI